jgi:hypothetical protein
MKKFDISKKIKNLVMRPEYAGTWFDYQRAKEFANRNLALSQQGKDADLRNLCNCYLRLLQEIHDMGAKK